MIGWDPGPERIGWRERRWDWWVGVWKESRKVGVESWREEEQRKEWERQWLRWQLLMSKELLGSRS